MASYLDQQPWQFRPYVATQPVEAMVKVGMMKQQQYDEGVQKIRDLLEQQTNLPVSRAVDIEYLQNSINSVTGQLKNLGAADFSNQQLVQSVAGLTKKISKDPYILDAVASTEKRRMELERRAELEKTGKTGIDNDTVFNKEWSNYYNSTDMGRRFTASYTPYTDVNKKAIDTIKSLHSNLQKIDDPYEILHGLRTGRIADVMKKYSVEGITENQIRTALRAAFTPDDYNQLRIESQARFMDMGSDKLANLALKEYEYKKLQTEKEIAKMKDLLPAYKGNPNKTAELLAQIKDYEDRLGKNGVQGSLERDYTNYLQNIKNNPDGVKYEIYKNGFFDQFANGFKWTHMSEELVKSPYFEVMDANRKFKLSEWEAQRKEYWNQKNYDKDLEELKLKYGTLGDEPYWQTSGNETTRNNEAVANYRSSMANISSQVDQYRSALTRAGMTPDAINTALEELRTTGRTSAEAKNVGALEKLFKAQNMLRVMDEADKKLLAQADKETGFDKAFQTLSRGLPGFKFTQAGVTMDLSPEDILAIRNATTLVNTYRGDPRGGVSGSGKFVADISRLNKKQADAVRLLDGVYFNVDDKQAMTNFPAFSQVMSTYSKANEGITALKQQRDQKHIELLGSRAGEFVTRLSGTPTTKEGKITPAIQSSLISLIQANTALDIAANNDYDTNTALGLLKDSENAKVLVENAGNKYNVIIKSFADPKAKAQVLKVNRDFVAKVFGEKYVNKYAEDATLLQLMDGTTTMDGNPENAVYSSGAGDFPNIRRYNVKGGVQQVTDGSGFIPVIHLENADGNWLDFNLAGEDMRRITGFESAMKGFGSMTDDQLERLIRQSYPSFDIRTLKKHR